MAQHFLATAYICLICKIQKQNRTPLALSQKPAMVHLHELLNKRYPVCDRGTYSNTALEAVVPARETSSD